MFLEAEGALASSLAWQQIQPARGTLVEGIARLPRQLIGSDPGVPSAMEAQQNARVTGDLLRRFRELGERMRQEYQAPPQLSEDEAALRVRTPACLGWQAPGAAGWSGGARPLQPAQTRPPPLLPPPAAGEAGGGGGIRRQAGGGLAPGREDGAGVRGDGGGCAALAQGVVVGRGLRGGRCRCRCRSGCCMSWLLHGCCLSCWLTPLPCPLPCHHPTLPPPPRQAVLGDLGLALVKLAKFEDEEVGWGGGWVRVEVGLGGEHRGLLLCWGSLLCLEEAVPGCPHTHLLPPTTRAPAWAHTRSWAWARAARRPTRGAQAWRRCATRAWRAPPTRRPWRRWSRCTTSWP